MEFRADLHCHTTCSDGTYSPEELIQHAKEKGLSGLAITDHDTVDAYDTAFDEAKKVGIELISGVEFSAAHKDVGVHILGYSFSTRDETIKAFCKKHLERRIKRYRAILDLLAKEQMPLAVEDILKENPKGTIGRPHIATAMLRKGYVGSFEEAFKKYLSHGKPCYVKGEAISVAETLEVIHKAGGLAVIAHPHLLNNPSVVRDLQGFPFDGIECFYARFGTQQNARWIEIGKKKNWIMTGGSDFHGTVKPNYSLGSSWTNEETFRILHNHFLNVQKA